MNEKVQKRKAEIEASLRNDEKFKEVMSAYSISCFESIIDKYAEEKALLELEGDPFEKTEEELEKNLMVMAESCLEEIQLMKLFTLECQWRAEQITLPGVEICSDFNVLDYNILARDIPDTVTEEDIQFYLEYLESPYVNVDLWFQSDYPDYDFIKKAYHSDDEDDQINGYLEFFLQRTGASVYLLLPNIRGEKEAFYQKLHHKHEKSKKKSIKAPSKPSLSSNSKNVAEIAYQIGDKKLASFIRMYERQQYLFKIHIQSAFYYLISLGYPLPVTASADWGEAIFELAAKHKYQCLAKVLPRAWEEYRRKKKLKLYEVKENKIAIMVRNTLRDNILHGRVLNGEPRDLRF